MSEPTSSDMLKRDPPGHLGHPGQLSTGCGGVLGRILRRFQPQQQSEQELAAAGVAQAPLPLPSPEATGRLSGMAKSIPDTAEERSWDDARALEVQAAVHARLEQAIATMPADYPHRQARLNVLVNERGIVAALIAKRDPLVWNWPRSLERLLERWREEDGEVRRQQVGRYPCPTSGTTDY